MRTIQHDLQHYIEVYHKHGTLINAAAELGISLETLQQVFIKNHIDYAKQVIYEVDHKFFSTLTPSSMYWAGFIAADGNVAKEKYRIAIALSRVDRSHLEKFRRDIKSTAPIKDTERTDNRPQFRSSSYKGSTIRITSKQIQNDLEQFNIVPHKSLSYTFPIHLSDHMYIHHFIHGLLDGDGWIYDNTHSKKEIGLSGTQATIEYVLQFLTNKLELETGTIHINNSGVYSFRIRKLSDMKKIITYLYQDCEDRYLERKYQNAQNILQYQERKLTFDLEALKELYSTYNTLQEIANKLGCSSSTVKRRLVENNLYIGKFGK